MNQFEIKNLKKSFNDQVVFDGFSAQIPEKSFTIITGSSGSGKSTLLNILGMLEPYDDGEIMLKDINLPKPYSSLATKLLRSEISYLFQNFGLIEDESISYNLDIVLKDVKKSQRKDLRIEALSQVGLSNLADKKIAACSGGEQQRIALARILLKKSNIILCDEPTGNLDEENAHLVIAILKQLNEDGKTIIVVTHDSRFLDVSTHSIKI